MIISGGVERLGASGSSYGDSTIGPLTLTVSSQSCFHITCIFNHYGAISAYGCARRCTAAVGPSTGYTIAQQIDDNFTTTYGGSWDISRVNSTSITITKSAGTYNGSGFWFIDIVGNNLVSFA